MPESTYSMGSPTHTNAPSDHTETIARFVHTNSRAGRILPSSSNWNSIELDFNVFPQSRGYESLPSRFSTSIDFDLTISDRGYFKRFVYIIAATLLLLFALLVLLHFLPHKRHHIGSSKNLTLALSHTLIFFDSQKSGVYPEQSLVNFRGDSGLQDGNSSNPPANLVGGFYDSGNNIKFSFPTAYTITILSWTVIEYHEKYDSIGELDHVKDIIKWGTDYLLELFVPPNTTSNLSSILYSQVGGPRNDSENDIKCWQRPEDMRYIRTVSRCDISKGASDLAGEIVAAFSAASLVFKDENNDYSGKLAKAAEELFVLVTTEGDGVVQGTYTRKDECGGQAREFYNSSGYKDELVWGGMWLFFATGNATYLQYTTRNLTPAEDEESPSEKGVFYWNNKLTATAVLLTRVRFFLDLGYPYEDAFVSSTSKTDWLMCSYLSSTFSRTRGGLIVLKPESGGAQLEHAAMASFLSKLYSDYLDVLLRSGIGCSDGNALSLDSLRSFSLSQVNYILGDNPMKMSYVVGYRNDYPTHVHHRAASIPWDNQWHSCDEGNNKWLVTEEPNPNVLLGAMVAGPDQNDVFYDERDQPWFTEPTIARNAGLVAALIALHDPPIHSSGLNGKSLGIDVAAIFRNFHLTP